jgi:hypothetical protein
MAFSSMVHLVVLDSTVPSDDFRKSTCGNGLILQISQKSAGRSESPHHGQAMMMLNRPLSSVRKEMGMSLNFVDSKANGPLNVLMY